MIYGKGNKNQGIKYLLRLSIGNGLFLVLIIFLHGCASQMDVKDHARNWMARPVSELKETMKSPDSYASKIGWKETTYKLASGNSVFIEPLSENCTVSWEVSQRGTIIGYKTAGKDCEDPDPNSFMKSLSPPPGE